MKDANLKPCPLCGSDKIIIKWKERAILRKWPRGERRWIECWGCGLEVNDSFYRIFNSLSEAIDYWNKRSITRQ